MKKIISIVLVATLFVACNNQAEAPVAVVDSVKAVDSVVKADSSPAQIDSLSVK